MSESAASIDEDDFLLTPGNPSLSSTNVFSQMESRTHDLEVRAWATDRLLRGKMADARAGYRAIAAHSKITDGLESPSKYSEAKDDEEARARQNVHMTHLEVRDYLLSGRLREAMAANGIREAYAEKAGLSIEPLNPLLLIGCGRICRRRGDIENAIEAYRLAGAKQDLEMLAFICRKNNQEKWAASAEEVAATLVAKE